MASTKTASDSQELNISADALAAVAKAVANAAIASTQRENDRPTLMNACGFPRADVPALVHKEVFFCGAPQKEDWLTPDEVTLYNAITVPGTYGPDKTWEVRLKDGRLHVLIHGINKREVRQELPRSLKAILSIIVEEQSAVAA